MAERISKKICKLCGVKPLTCHDYDLNEFELYPDFGSPENFVKLLELKYTPASTIGSLRSHSTVFMDRSDFLRALYSYLSNEDNPQHYQNANRTLIKSKIKGAQWKYE